MKTKDLIKELKKYDLESNVRFYYLKDRDLTACKLETILKPSDWSLFLYNEQTTEIIIENEVSCEHTM